MNIGFYASLLVATTTMATFSTQGVQAQTTPQTIAIEQSTGQWTSSNAAKTWHAVWTSNQSDPQVTLRTDQNNMAYKDGGILLFTGGNSSCNYTIMASPGYEVKGYEFDFTLSESKGKTVTITPEGKAALTSSSTTEVQHVALTDLSSQAVNFTVSTTAGNKSFALIKNVKVTVAKSAVANSTKYLYTTQPGQKPFRIPAMAKTKSGRLLAFSDYRPNGNDIGFGEVDIQLRTSDDNGATWSNAVTIANGDGNGSALTCGFGDAAVVADRETNDVLMLCVAGKVPYGHADYSQGNPLPIVRFVSHDEGRTWQPYENITNQVYGLFDNSKNGKVKSLFVGSGKLCQSSTIKNGTHHRVYAPVAARDGGNRVLFSDDFGATWHVLGGADALPCPGGDEPKIEELPDGRILLSSRVSGGRLFNIFAYSNKQTGEGTWGTPAKSDQSNNGVVAQGNACNGEILILPVKRNSDNQQMFLALQSVPFGNGRTNVGIYYKELPSLNAYVTPEAFARDWTGRKQISKMGSAYSTMLLQKDEKIAFYYEESTYGADYTEVYLPLSLEDITNNAYTYDSTVPAPGEDENVIGAEDIELLRQLLDYKGLGYPKENAPSRVALEAILRSPADFNNTQLMEEVDKFYDEEDVEMPVDGKRYIIRVMAKNGTHFYLDYDGSDVKVTEQPQDAVPAASAYFTAHLSADKKSYSFTTADGKYLCNHSSYKGVDWLETESTTGFTTSYDPVMSPIKLHKFNTSPKTEGTVFSYFGGFYAVSARGKKADGTAVQGAWIINTENKTYDGAPEHYFTDKFSSLLRFQQVIAPLGAEVTTLADVDGTKAYALYNAHFTTYAINKAGETNVWAAGMKGDATHAVANAEFSKPYSLDDLNGGWQLFQDKEGKWYLYNIAAKGYVKTGRPCTFTPDPTPINVTEIEGGFAFNTTEANTNFFCAAPQFASEPLACWTSDDDGSRWVLVENPNLEADIETFNRITGLDTVLAPATPKRTGIYDLYGRRLEVVDPSELPTGLYIIDGRKQWVK